MIDSSVLEAGQTTAVFTDRSTLGILRIKGETRLDLIHRMSTQAVKQLKSGQGTATILTSDIGRIIDRLILYATSDTVYALTGEHNSDTIARYLMRYVFFNDDFQLEDVSEQTAVYAIYGPQSQATLQEMGLQADLPLHHWNQQPLGNLEIYLHRTDPLFGDGYFLMCQATDKEAVKQQLLDAGLPEANADTFDHLRIAGGLPRFGHEITGDYIPLETNLWNDVSFTKGCYIGQEIIARMESRGRLAKKLVSLRASDPLTTTDIRTSDGKQAGTITSTSTHNRETVALGYIKTKFLDETTPLEAENQPIQIHHQRE